MKTSSLKLNFKRIVNGMWSLDRKICFILIPKCAHLSMTYTLGNEGFEELPLNVNVGRAIQYAAIVRDPLEKWITGIATYLTAKVDNGNITRDEAMVVFKVQKYIDFIFQNVELDAHTMSQCGVLSQVKGDIDLFPIEYIDKLIPWFNDKGVPIKGIDTAHMTKNFPKGNFHYRIYKFINEFMSTNNRYCDIINEYFKEDLEIHQRALNYFKEI